MKLRELFWLGLAVAILLGAFFLVRSGQHRPGRPVAVRALGVVPPGPAFVLTVDVARLRTTEAGKAVLAAGWASLWKAEKDCPFEPLRDVDEVVLAVPSETTSQEPPLAVIATGRFAGPVIADCSARRVKAGGIEPVRTTIGSFVSVRNPREPGEVAAKNGLLVLSDGSYLRALLDGAEGHGVGGDEAARVRDRIHSELRRTFGKDAPVIATLTLAEGWLEAALDDPEVARSPLAKLRSAALRVTVADRVRIEAFLACAHADDCAPVERFLNDARKDLGALVGPELAARVATVRITRRADRIELSADASLDEARAFLREN